MFLTCIHSSCQYFILHYLPCFSVYGLSTTLIFSECTCSSGKEMHSEQARSNSLKCFQNCVSSLPSVLEIFTFSFASMLSPLLFLSPLFVTLPPISAPLNLWGLSSASFLLFIIQRQASVACLRALNFE